MDADQEEASEDDSSLAGTPPPNRKLKRFCAVCLVEDAEQWYKCPAGLGEATVGRKEKTLCQSCAIQWRHCKICPFCVLLSPTKQVMQTATQTPRCLCLNLMRERVRDELTSPREKTDSPLSKRQERRTESRQRQDGVSLAKPSPFRVSKTAPFCSTDHSNTANRIGNTNSTYSQDAFTRETVRVPYSDCCPLCETLPQIDASCASAPNLNRPTICVTTVAFHCIQVMSGLSRALLIH